MKPIPFLRVRLPDPDAVARDYAAICATGIFTNRGPAERRFAAGLEQWIGNGVAASVTSNATAGIQLACRALFRRDRRQVLVASFTYAAGPLAILWSGYEPVLIDIEPDSWQPSVAAAEAFLRHSADEVAGIVLTNTFGTANASIERWELLAARYGLALVIDSAPGFASTYSWGEPLGSRGDCEVFSFHATKTVAVGEGGAVVARDHRVIEEIDRLKNFGFDDAGRSQNVGMNAKLSELASAIGLRQLGALPQRLPRRRDVLHHYVEHLEALGCEFQADVQSSVPPFLSTALGSRHQRDALSRALDEAGIGWRSYYDPPVHRQPSFAGARTVGDLPVTDDLAGRIVSLPLDDDFTRDDVARVAAVVGSVTRG